MNASLKSFLFGVFFVALCAAAYAQVNASSSAGADRTKPTEKQDTADNKLPNSLKRVGGQAASAVKKPTLPVLDQSCNIGVDNRNSDLCAQWKAADAASSSAFWTWISTLVAIGGVLGLYWQISLTRKAVEDTSSATQAMLESNRIAKEQTRPYIGLDSSNCVFSENGVGFELNFKNFGQSPAVNVRNFTTYCYSAWPIHADPQTLAGQPSSSGTLFPAVGMQVFGALTLTQQDLASIQAGTGCVIAHGTIEYQQSLNGPVFKTGYRFYFGGNIPHWQVFNQNGGGMWICDEGNFAS
jgi:hypothetical protein